MKKVLKNVTLLGVDCVDIDRLILTADICQRDFEFGAVKLLTSLPLRHKDVVQIDQITSKQRYSDFIVRRLNDYVETDFVLLVQHDGFILNPSAWDDTYLNYDYIGAPWWEKGQYIVGNGGFSLRSKKFLEATQLIVSKEVDVYPEDWFLCVTIRDELEKKGIRFALSDLARRFSFESNERDGVTWNGQFGFHGLTWTDISPWLKQHPEYPIKNKLDRWAMSIQKRISSSKGSLAVSIHVPEKQTDRLAVLCPGFLDSKDYAHLVGLADQLTDRGYTVVRFDATGMWESDGAIEDYSTTQYLADVKNVIDYMLMQGDYKHILLGGHSLGGFISMLYAARDHRVSVVLNIMGSHSLGRENQRAILEKWKASGMRVASRDIPGTDQQREFRIPYSYAEDRLRYDVLDEIQNIHVPLIFVAGTADDMVPAENVQETFDGANEPKRMIIIPDIGHDYRHSPNQIRLVNTRILSTLTEVLP